MAFDHEEWLSSLKDKYPDLEVPDEAVQGWMRQSDYDKNFNQLKKEHTARMKKEDDYHAALKAAEDKLILVQQLEQQFGPVDYWSDALTSAIAREHPELGEYDMSDNLSLERVQELIRQTVDEAVQPLQQNISNVGRGAAVMVDFMAEALPQWKETYGQKFPKKEFTEFFQNSGLSDPYMALQIFERPYQQEKLESDHKQQLEDAEKKGYQAAMSKYGHVETPAGPQGEGMFFKLSSPTPKLDPESGKPIEQPKEVSREEQRARVGSAYQKAIQNYQGPSGGAGGTNNSNEP